MGLLEQTRRYAAIRKSADMGPYGYWTVTYSAAPGVDITVQVCQTGITPATAASLADAALTALTGQKVYSA